MSDKGLMEVPRKSAWYLLQCKSRQEGRAKEHLDRQGYTCFSPAIQVERIRHGKRVILTEPLFPGYLFVSLDLLNDNWARIRSTRGVVRLVSFNAAPAAVPQNIINGLMQREKFVDQPEQALKSGDSLKINSGPFKDLEVVFQSYDGEERVFVLLNILQNQQKLSIPLKELNAV